MFDIYTAAYLDNHTVFILYSFILQSGFFIYERKCTNVSHLSAQICKSKSQKKKKNYIWTLYSQIPIPNKSFQTTASDVHVVIRVYFPPPRTSDNPADLHRAAADSVLCSVGTGVCVPPWNPVIAWNDTWLWQESEGNYFIVTSEESWGDDFTL